MNLCSENTLKGWVVYLRIFACGSLNKNAPNEEKVSPWSEINVYKWPAETTDVLTMSPINYVRTYAYIVNFNPLYIYLKYHLHYKIQFNS